MMAMRHDSPNARELLGRRFEWCDETVPVDVGSAHRLCVLEGCARLCECAVDRFGDVVGRDVCVAGQVGEVEERVVVCGHGVLFK